MTVRVQVPVRPFPEGVLAGALSPRQLAEKAHEAPKEAAALIESGAVARWYAANGWTYPVFGPTAAGPAAVQQLFEALGLVQPPRVELSEDAVRLQGRPGETVEYVLAVVTQENRAAVAHGTSDQPWLQVGPTVFRGRTAFLPLSVAPCPDGRRDAAGQRVDHGQRQPALRGARSRWRSAACAAPCRRAGKRAADAAVPPLAGRRRCRARPRLVTRRRCCGLHCWRCDRQAARRRVSARPPPEVEALPRLDIRYHDARKDDELEKLWLTDPQPSRRFGLVTLRQGQEVGQGATLRRLTFDPWGRTNNTCLRFDDRDERLFGSAGGHWEGETVKSWQEGQGQHQGVRCVWVCDDKKIQVTQFVELVRGDQSRSADTCRVRYLIENQDGSEHKVGIRFLLDTYIGGNDGVPFTIPGDSVLCDTLKDLPSEATDKKMPDFLQALEKPDLAHPGTVAHLRLKLERLEAPVRVTLGAWPNEKLRVQAPQGQRPLDALGRAAAVDEVARPERLGQSPSTGRNDRSSRASSGRSASSMAWATSPAEEAGWRRRLTAIFRPDGELTVVAYVNPAGPQDEDETLTLALPAGFKILEGAEQQTVPKLPADAKNGNRPVTWKVQAGSSGIHEFTVTSSSGRSQSLAVVIRRAGGVRNDHNKRAARHPPAGGRRRSPCIFSLREVGSGRNSGPPSIRRLISFSPLAVKYPAS